MLNMAKVELELIPDPDMYFLFEKGMKSGVSYISKRYIYIGNILYRWDIIITYYVLRSE